MNDVTLLKNGEVRHNQYTVAGEPNKQGTSAGRKFKSMTAFNSWKAKHVRELKALYKEKLTPH